MYTLFYFKWKKKAVYDHKIKHVPSVYGCGDEQFCAACVTGPGRGTRKQIKNT